ncbi:MAG: hypothetical protein ACQKBU_10540 [Verrucomicrobiales bacterium]
MFILSEPAFAGDLPANPNASGGRRFYRSRNALAGDALHWEATVSMPADVPNWDDMVGCSLRAGLRAAKQSLKPAFVVWGLMLGVAVLYYAVPASQAMFTSLARFQDRLGLLFPFLGMGFSVGLMAEGVKVCMSKEKRWTRENSINAVFNFALFGSLGVVQNYFYALQETMFGMGSSWKVLLPKVLMDQFVFTVFFANPYQSVLYLWRNRGFSWKAVTAQLFPFKPFWGTQVLPVLIANWFFWIPMVSIIYCFPSELQLPLAILAVTIWVLLLSILTSENREEA